jgi:hypothetical protein
MVGTTFIQAFNAKAEATMELGCVSIRLAAGYFYHSGFSFAPHDNPLNKCEEVP